ncbi:magnesium/cobalt transporter CorA [Paenibacillus sp. N1-5-1-14]|uniref:magnesium/cobalt transporter CorA n=1 Tax=Paenibacillus radicibacter TaxID=2972488 RepID=UPI0021594DE8|nr:magnesium/cobalt transporter CorA [Paenibacillus radicibacter]MCR8644056.1 magnesium/cobalt transporter CorA [Paenibacillus radicibacter]
MIRTLAITKDNKLLEYLTLEQLKSDTIQWYWVDLTAPTEEEGKLLQDYFHFHPLAIEDCFNLLQRPKLDHYDDIQFLILHAIEHPSLVAKEINMFVGPNFIVTFSLEQIQVIEEARERVRKQSSGWQIGPLFAAHAVIDKTVDQYFPCVHQIEDGLDDLESSHNEIVSNMDQLFAIRSRLLKLRRTIIPMRDLLYHVINSNRIPGLKEHLFYFSDIHDHLLKLTDMIESNREITADLRDSYISLNSNRMNSIMKTLTVITVIFMPLTFLAGVYGMNFTNMPELGWKWGYFIVIGIMITVAGSMYVWFKRKGWFE